MDRLFFRLTLCCIYPILAGCIQARVVTPYQAHPSNYSKGIPSKAAKAKKLLAYPRTPLKVHTKIYAKQDIQGYTITHLSFKSVGQNGQDNNEAGAEFFESSLPGPKKLVIVLPVWGGSLYPGDAMSLGIVKASAGNVDLIKFLAPKPIIEMEKLQTVKSKKELIHLIKTLSIRTRNAIINIQRLINWTLKHKNISKKSVYILGFSKGTILASIIAQIDPQITHAILVIGGSSVARLVYGCDYYSTYQYVTKNVGITKKQYFALLEKYLNLYYTYNFPTRLNPRHVLIFESKYDNCFWPWNREALWLAMGQPTRISFLYDHRLSFGAMTLGGAFYMRHKIYKFIKKGHTST